MKEKTATNFPVNPNKTFIVNFVFTLPDIGDIFNLPPRLQ